MQEKMRQRLDRISLFDLLSGEEKEQIAWKFERVTIAMGQTVIAKDELPDALYIILSGQARIIGTKEGTKLVSLGKLGPGEHFGEQSLFGTERAEVSIAAANSLHVLKLERQAFAELTRNKPELEHYFRAYMSHDGMRLFLKNSTVLSHLDFQAIRSLLDSFEIREYERGQDLVREGEQGDAFYIIRTGRASVEQGAERHVLNKLLPGDFFGELSLLTGAPRKASVRAEEPITAFRLGKSEFEALIVRFPKIRQAIEEITAHYSQTPIAWNEDDEEAEKAYETASLFAKAAGETSERNIAGRRFNMIMQMKRLFGKKYPAMMQQNEMDCGPTCLSMIVQYYGGFVSLNKIRQKANVTTEGTSLQGLLETAEKLGFEAQGLKVGLADLKGMEKPCILHWEGRHYVVLYELDEEEALIADPAVGLTERVSLKFLTSKWNGIVLSLTPTEAVSRLRERDALYARFVPFFAPHKKSLFTILLLSIVIQLVLLTLPIFTQLIVDKVLVQRNTSLLQILLAGMLSLALFQFGFLFVRQYGVARTALKLDIAMVGAFYKKLFDLPYDYFMRRTVGDVITRVSENENIRRMLTDHAVYFLLDVLAVIIYGSLMFYYHMELALISLAFLPVFGFVIAWLIPRMRKNSRKQFIAEGESHSQVVESVHAIATVKALAAEKVVRGKLENKLKASLQLRMQGYLLTAGADASSSLLQIAAQVLLLYCGSRYVLAGELSVGELVAFSGLFLTMVHSVDSITRMLNDISEARISMERLNDVFEAVSEQPDPQKLRILPPIRGNIQFENVSFRYEAGSRNILQNLTFEIKPGQTIAIVGRSGSGKTTFINLLLKLYDPTDGSLRIDGVNIREIHARSFRQQIGVVQQENTIFRGTIAENIAYHLKGATPEEIESAAQLAGAHEFIASFPLGYETVIGEGGMKLSGGQRQRVAIARALIGDPRLLIFDEATSALDTESERLIQRNMDLILKDRTTILIAHRLSTVRKADRIVVLDQGTIVESGTHEELLELRGLYHHLIHQQLE
ncbi:peptidase domain-containing ABC transporter [Paenibacillus sp. GCM10027628]|uniref:peptidase domain-containing ABC transporter n=1 Tax=Paenibacillus sp. GCM10027628 TaxID=3273413 RepID=UPI00362BD28E